MSLSARRYGRFSQLADDIRSRVAAVIHRSRPILVQWSTAAAAAQTLDVGYAVDKDGDVDLVALRAFRRIVSWDEFYPAAGAAAGGGHHRRAGIYMDEVALSQFTSVNLDQLQQLLSHPHSISNSMLADLGKLFGGSVDAAVAFVFRPEGDNTKWCVFVGYLSAHMRDLYSSQTERVEFSVTTTVDPTSQQQYLGTVSFSRHNSIHAFPGASADYTVWVQSMCADNFVIPATRVSQTSAMSIYADSGFALVSFPGVRYNTENSMRANFDVYLRYARGTVISDSSLGVTISGESVQQQDLTSFDWIDKPRLYGGSREHDIVILRLLDSLKKAGQARLSAQYHVQRVGHTVQSDEAGRVVIDGGAARYVYVSGDREGGASIYTASQSEASGEAGGSPTKIPDIVGNGSSSTRSKIMFRSVNPQLRAAVQYCVPSNGEYVYASQIMVTPDAAVPVGQLDVSHEQIARFAASGEIEIAISGTSARDTYKLGRIPSSPSGGGGSGGSERSWILSSSDAGVAYVERLWKSATLTIYYVVVVKMPESFQFTLVSVPPLKDYFTASAVASPSAAARKRVDHPEVTVKDESEVQRAKVYAAAKILDETEIASSPAAAGSAGSRDEPIPVLEDVVSWQPQAPQNVSVVASASASAEQLRMQAMLREIELQRRRLNEEKEAFEKQRIAAASAVHPAAMQVKYEGAPQQQYQKLVPFGDANVEMDVLVKVRLVAFEQFTSDKQFALSEMSVDARFSAAPPKIIAHYEKWRYAIRPFVARKVKNIVHDGRSLGHLTLDKTIDELRNPRLTPNRIAQLYSGYRFFLADVRSIFIRTRRVDAQKNKMQMVVMSVLHGVHTDFQFPIGNFESTWLPLYALLVAPIPADDVVEAVNMIHAFMGEARNASALDYDMLVTQLISERNRSLLEIFAVVTGLALYVFIDKGIPLWMKRDRFLYGFLATMYNSDSIISWRNVVGTLSSDTKRSELKAASVAAAAASAASGGGGNPVF